MKMATPTVSSDSISFPLLTDVYQEHFDFTELVRDVLASINNHSSDGVVRSQVQLLLSTVGRDPLKLHTLVQVVNTKMQSQLSWVETAAVKFYRALFDDIDPTLELDIFGHDSLMGADIAAKYVLEEAGDFVTHANWEFGSAHIVELSINLLKASSIGERQSAIAENLGCSLLERMAKSLYLHFYNNYDIFSFFTYDIALRLDTADGSMKSARVTEILKALKEEDYERTVEQKAQLKHMCTILGRSDLYQEPVQSAADERAYGHIPTGLLSSPELEHEVATSLRLFASIPDWGWPAIGQLLKSISNAMRIDAPLSVQTATLDTIEAMIHSECLFLHKNVQILVFFVLSVAPVLDGMSDASQSHRLTALLDDLNIHRSAHTVQDRDSIDGLRKILGRPVGDEATALCTDHMFEEAELSKAVSKLEID